MKACLRPIVALAMLAAAPALLASAPPEQYVVTAETVKDVDTGLTWQRAAPSGTYTWAEAKTYCVGLSLAGTLGWRLPTHKELLTLVDFSVAAPGPTIDATAFPGTEGSRFWTSTHLAISGSTKAWYVSFADGTSSAEECATARSARCVR